MNARAYVLLVLGFVCSAASAANTYRYGQAPPHTIGGPIELRDMYGAHFSLNNLRGRPALLFFGFAGCGSTCPIAMATAKQLLRSFAGKDAPSVLFVTLDPLGDTPQRLQRYLGAFDTRIIGLTGDHAAVAQTLDRYGVAVQTHEDGIDHSAKWYLIGRSGQVERVYRYTTPAVELAADLRSARAVTESAHARD